MKPIQLFAAGVSLFSLQLAFADDAYLRLRCDGEAAGAAVFINGAKKGECPIDLSIPEGNVRLVVRKVLDQYRFRSFEKELLLPAGAMKRETVVLGDIQFTPEGQQIENERLAREKAEADRVAAEKAAQAAIVAEQQRIAAAEAAKYGLTNDYLQMLSSKDPRFTPVSVTTYILYSPLFLPTSALSDLSSGKKLYRVASDPAVFANPDAMVARASRQDAAGMTPVLR